MKTGTRRVVRPKHKTDRAMTLHEAKQREGYIASDLDTLSRKYGAEVLRIAALRYFKRQHEEEQLRHEIAARSQELERLRQRAYTIKARSGKVRKP